ncbi:MAG: hypothetical protein K2J84_02145 [Bacteroidaceae bacterium]|nr:hypothetical protein [Bacteroidaceae bacterium]
MGFFDLWGTKPRVADVPQEAEMMPNMPVDERSEQENSNDGRRNLVTITWGTGMPIDVIFGFIHKDFENEGYNDAIVVSDLKYGETKESIIRNDLKMLFKRVTLRYRHDIRKIDVQIKNAQEAYILSVVSELEAQRDTYEEHLAEIAEMERLLEADDPKMTKMIESYRRGFLKGIAAQTTKFITQN